MKLTRYYIFTITALLHLPSPAATPPKEELPKQPKETVRKEFEKERAQHAEFLTGRFHRKAETATTSTASGSLDDEEVAQKDVKTSAATGTATQPTEPTQKRTLPSLVSLSADYIAQPLFDLWRTSDDFDTTLKQSRTLLALENAPSGTDTIIARELQSIIIKDRIDTIFMLPAVLTQTSIIGAHGSWNKELTACAYTDEKLINLFIWDAATRTTHPIIRDKDDQNKISCIAWNPHDNLITYSTRNGSIKLVHTPLQKPTFTTIIQGNITDILAQMQKAINYLSWNPQGTFLVSAAGDGLFNIYDTKTHEYRLIGTSAAGFLPSFAWNHQGTLFAYADEVNKTVHFWDTQQHQSSSVDMSIPIKALAWNPQSNLLAISTNAGIELYNSNTQTIDSIHKSSPYGNSPSSLSWNPAGTLLAGGFYGKISIIDPIKKASIFNITIAHQLISSLSWNPQGALVYGNNRLVNIKNRQVAMLSRQVDKSNDVIHNLNWNPQGTAFALLMRQINGPSSSCLFTVPQFTMDQLLFILGAARLSYIEDSTLHTAYKKQLERSPIIDSFAESYTDQIIEIKYAIDHL